MTRCCPLQRWLSAPASSERFRTDTTHLVEVAELQGAEGQLLLGTHRERFESRAPADLEQRSGVVDPVGDVLRDEPGHAIGKAGVADGDRVAEREGVVEGGSGELEAARGVRAEEELCGQQGAQLNADRRARSPEELERCPRRVR